MTIANTSTGLYENLLNCSLNSEKVSDKKDNSKEEKKAACSKFIEGDESLLS